MTVRVKKAENFAEYQNNSKICDFTENRKCSKCGGCCSNQLPLTNNEIKRLKRIVKDRKLDVQLKKDLGKTIDLTCPFLQVDEKNDTTRCAIYEDRPFICRVWQCNKQNSIVFTHTNKLKELKTYNVRKTIFGWE